MRKDKIEMLDWLVNVLWPLVKDNYDIARVVNRKIIKLRLEQAREK